jgi:hypothetical protein
MRFDGNDERIVPASGSDQASNSILPTFLFHSSKLNMVVIKESFNQAILGSDARYTRGSRAPRLERAS